MKWFKHFTNAHTNNSLTKIRMKYGADGYAIYWYCLELIAGDLGNSEDVTFELKHDAEVIGYNLKIDTLKVEEIMRYIVTLGLFEDHDSMITCFKLAKYLDKKNTRNMEIQKIINTATLSATVRDSPPTVPACPRLSAADKKRREENKDITSNGFDEFWIVWPYKKAKQDAKKAWKRMASNDRILASRGVIQFWQNKKPDFYINPATYLNGKRWEDEEPSNVVTHNFNDGAK